MKISIKRKLNKLDSIIRYDNIFKKTVNNKSINCFINNNKSITKKNFTIYFVLNNNTNKNYYNIITYY